MSVHGFRIPVVVQDLGGGLLLAEGLLFPEISRISDSRARLLGSLSANARRLLENTPLLDLHRRRFNGQAEIRDVSLSLDVPEDLPLWSKPLELHFNAVCWQQGEARIARVPALNIEVVATGKDDLDKLLPLHIRAALSRRKMAQSLRELFETQRVESASVEFVTVVPQLVTPREAAKAEGQESAPPSVLAEVATDLCAQSPAEAYEVEDLAGRLADFLGGEHPSSVLLVGASGVGKTALFGQLVRERAQRKLGATPFWATSGSRLVAGMSGYGMWQQRCDNLRREAAKTRAIVHLGSLMELIDVGKAEGMEQGVAGFLRPFIARGELLCVAECTPEQLPLIERQEPQLLNVFQRLVIDEPTPRKAHAILRRAADALAVAPKAPVKRKRAQFDDPGQPPELSNDGLDKLERLHRRFAAYSAWPGRPLRFLRNLMRDGRPATTLGASDVTLAFARETGLPLGMLDEDAELKLDDLREYFASRVIGQGRATDLVVDLLATFKAGLSRPKKPLASFLFIGPTGVGKTEMARTLAEYLFGDRSRLTRFDMSEYSDASSVQRLIAGKGGEGLLTSKAREQPFAVILFDEFEKADASFFDLLLQVLGEGRLTDAQGRVADFSNSVIIMTSNLGAQGYMQGSLGFAKGNAAAKAEAHFAAEVRGFLRPELVNRIDRIVPFMPLDRQAITHVAARELELAQLRAQAAGRVDLALSPEVAAHIAALGWQEQYGARPLKRALEQHLLVPLAIKLSQTTAQGRLQAAVSVVKGELMIDVRAKAARKRKDQTADHSKSELASESMLLRRRAQQLSRSPVVLELASEIYNLERFAKAAQKRKRKSSFTGSDAHSLKRLPRCKEAMGRVESLMADARLLESRALMAIFGRESGDLAAEDARIRIDWHRALLGLYMLRFEQSELCTLALNGERPAMFALAAAYLAALRAGGFDASLYRYVRELSNAELRALNSRADEESRRVRIEYSGRLRLGADICVPVFDEDSFFADPPEGLPTLSIQVLGEQALPKLLLEAGMHLLLLEPGQKPLGCRVDCTELGPMDYRAPLGEVREKLLQGAEVRRKYDLPLRKLMDLKLDRVIGWPGREVATALAAGIEGGFAKALEAQVAT